MLLGFNTLRTMVLASGMTTAFKAPDNFDMKTFWRDSFAVGALSKWLANYVDGCDRETAFTCGMLHSVGELLIHMVMPKEAHHIDEALSMGGTRHTLERGQLGFTSADVGAELAKRWKFPAEMQQAILEQNNPDLDRTYSALAGILHIAQYLNKAHKDGLDEEAILAKFPKAVADAIGMNCDKAYADLADSNDLSSGLEGLLE